MNISKLIAKFVLAFLVFSSLSVQGPILAGSRETENLIPGVTENQQQAEEYRFLRERSRWKYMFTAVACLALSARSLPISYADCRSGEYVTGTVLCFFGCAFAIGGALGVHDFLKARFWGK